MFAFDGSLHLTLKKESKANEVRVQKDIDGG
jgi:hypothetical protein